MLSVIEAEPVGADVIDRLEELLEKARAGEISSVAAAVVYRDGSTGSCWSSAPSFGLLIGSTAVLQANLIAMLKGDT